MEKKVVWLVQRCKFDELNKNVRQSLIKLINGQIHLNVFLCKEAGLLLLRL